MLSIVGALRRVIARYFMPSTNLAAGPRGVSSPFFNKSESYPLKATHGHSRCFVVHVGMILVVWRMGWLPP
jgi:hypothetical protein